MTQSRRVAGIDFSGNAAMWRERCSRSNVWIAELAEAHPLPVVVRLSRVQELPGAGDPFARLRDHLRTAPITVAAIDAPFSLPRAYLPPGGRRELLAQVLRLETPGRPFPRGEQLLELLGARPPHDRPKPLRETEQAWRDEGVNVRSTLWLKPRGGAPFTVACLRLLAATGLPCWPWERTGAPLLVEAFPAAQLKTWGLPHAGYDRERRPVREAILAGLAGRIALPEPLAEQAAASPDALDATVCALAALAVAQGRVAPPPDEVGDEGWIAVDPS